MKREHSERSRLILLIENRALSRAHAVGSAALGTPSICDQLAETLDAKQVHFCKKHPSFMLSVQTGASRAIDECKFQFRTRRWNCSTLDDTSTSSKWDSDGPLRRSEVPTTIVSLPSTSKTSKKKNAKGEQNTLSNETLSNEMNISIV